MKQTRLLMGMPITVEIAHPKVASQIFDDVYEYFKSVDERFSPFKSSSEVSLINSGQLTPKGYSFEMKQILKLCAQTKDLTDGFFDISKDGLINPSGLVKGWAIQKAAALIKAADYQDFYIEAGGDIQTYGKTRRIGIRNPFNKSEIVKILNIKDKGVATSGNYERGLHLYNPKTGLPADEIASMTVIGPNIYEADRFATAAFVMGKKGIMFIENLRGFEGYLIGKDKMAIYTSGFEKYVG